ncbi:MAG: NAD(P)-binding domain-containing protein [Pseudomonadota bacterium]
MKIGFIGHGSMAQALASKWHQHDLFFGGRTPARAKAVAERFGAGAGTAAEAARFGDVVVLATRHEDVFTAIEAAGGAAAFAGKIVIDINNPVSIETFLSTRPDARSLTQAIADALPGAQVAKAFNMAQAKVWEREEMLWDGRRLTVPYTADDAHTADVVGGLIEEVGAEALLIGGTPFAYQLEAGAAMVIKQLFSGADPLTVLTLIRPSQKPI